MSGSESDGVPLLRYAATTSGSGDHNYGSVVVPARRLYGGHQYSADTKAESIVCSALKMTPSPVPHRVLTSQTPSTKRPVTEPSDRQLRSLVSSLWSGQAHHHPDAVQQASETWSDLEASEHVRPDVPSSRGLSSSSFSRRGVVTRYDGGGSPPFEGSDVNMVPERIVAQTLRGRPSSPTAVERTQPPSPIAAVREIHSVERPLRPDVAQRWSDLDQTPSALEVAERKLQQVQQERAAAEQRAQQEAEEAQRLREIEAAIAEEEMRKEKLLAHRQQPTSQPLLHERNQPVAELSSPSPTRSPPASGRVVDDSALKHLEQRLDAEHSHSEQVDMRISRLESALSRSPQTNSPMVAPAPHRNNEPTLQPARIVRRSPSPAPRSLYTASDASPKRNVFVSVVDVIETEAADRSNLREDEITDRQFLRSLHDVCRDALEGPENLMQHLL